MGIQFQSPKGDSLKINCVVVFSSIEFLFFFFFWGQLRKKVPSCFLEMFQTGWIKNAQYWSASRQIEWRFPSPKFHGEFSFSFPLGSLELCRKSSCLFPLDISVGGKALRFVETRGKRRNRAPIQLPLTFLLYVILDSKQGIVNGHCCSRVPFFF